MTGEAQPRGMVVSPHFLASEAGATVLADGGTAVEAAVATAATLAVVYPHMNAIGGDSFWLSSRPGEAVRGIDACGRAAAAADLSLYAGHDVVPWRGHLAANTVAGAISGWIMALEQDHGTLPLERLLRDAIGHAHDGVAVTAGGAEVAEQKGPELRAQPGAYAAIFEPQGRPLKQGEILKQPALARTLERLASDGLDSFYRGALGQRIAADLASLGSPVALADLIAHRAEATMPLSVAIRGARLFNHPPPTQGVASLMILALFDRLAAEEAEGFAHVHGLVEATKQAFLWRDRHCGDPAHMTVDAQRALDDAGMLAEMVGAIDPERALPWPQPSQAGDTVWFGAIDRDGGMASVIQSTYFEFGSGLVLPESGIILQNRGASFRLEEDGWNALKPGRKPFHTLNPAMAFFDDGRAMVYGTMGGEGQPQTQAALFSRYARFGVPLQEAISRPRWLLGRTWGQQSTSLKMEDGFAPELYRALAEAGHDVEQVGPLTSMMGHAHAIVRHPDGRLDGAVDPRSDGGVATC